MSSIFLYTRKLRKPFRITLRTRTWDKLLNLKKAISVDSKELSVYITRNLAREYTEHLHLMLKKKQKTRNFEEEWPSPKTKNCQIR